MEVVHARCAGLDVHKKSVYACVICRGTDGKKRQEIRSFGTMTADLLKRIGFNLDYQSLDWGTVVQRRASKEPIDKGGWNIFATGWVGADLLDPAGNPALRTNGEKAHFGWPSDDKIEALRVEWMKAASPDDRKKLAEAIQTRAFEIVPYIPTGQWTPKTAFRNNIKGIITAPAFLMWNVEKT